MDRESEMGVGVAARAKQPRAVRAAVTAVIVVGVLACTAALLQALMTITGRLLYAGGGADPRKPLIEMPQLIQADIQDGHSMFLEDLPAWLRTLSATPLVLHALVVAVAVAIVVRLCHLIAAGRAFGRPARTALARLSLVLIVGGVVQGIVDGVAVGVTTTWIATATGPDGQFERAVQGWGIALPSFPVMLIVLGIISSALAVAFRQGSAMREELSGVV